MASKNISIRKEIYERLTRLKKENQSYSDLIEKLLEEGLKGSYSNLMKHFGRWGNFPPEIFEQMINIRKNTNKSINERLLRRLEDLE